MNDILIALGIGTVAGVIDVVPMRLQKLDKFACTSAFMHWLVLGLIIPSVDWALQPWIKGLILAELTAIPVMILVYPKDPKALIPMTIFSALLGSGVGLAGAYFL